MGSPIFLLPWPFTQFYLHPPFWLDLIGESGDFPGDKIARYSSGSQRTGTLEPRKQNPSTLASSRQCPYFCNLTSNFSLRFLLRRLLVVMIFVNRVLPRRTLQLHSNFQRRLVHLIVLDRK